MALALLVAVVPPAAGICHCSQTCPWVNDIIDTGECPPRDEDQDDGMESGDMAYFVTGALIVFARAYVVGGETGPDGNVIAAPGDFGAVVFHMRREEIIPPGQTPPVEHANVTFHNNDAVNWTANQTRHIIYKRANTLQVEGEFYFRIVPGAPEGKLNMTFNFTTHEADIHDFFLLTVKKDGGGGETTSGTQAKTAHSQNEPTAALGVVVALVALAGVVVLRRRRAG